jgi:MFS family permease
LSSHHIIDDAKKKTSLAAGAGEQLMGGSRENLALLLNRDFRSLWTAGMLNWIVFGIEQLATSIYIFSITQSPLMVTSLVAARMIPMIILGSIAGAVSERLPGIPLLSFGYWTLAIVFFTLGAISVWGDIQLWHIFVGAFFTGTGLTLDNTVRRKAIGELASETALGPAMSLDITTLMLAMLLGPLVGGMLYEHAGLSGVYFCIGLCFVVAQAAIRKTLLPAVEKYHKERRLFSEIIEGIRYARSNRIITATLVITIVMNVFVLALYGLVPVVGIDVLKLKPSINGVLLASNGAGGFIGALLISIYGAQSQYRRYFFWGSLLLSASILAFSISTTFYLSVALLMVGGFGLAGFGTMQVALLLLETPSHLRARILGLLTVCIGVGPIGVLHVGYMAEIFGTVNGLGMIALEGIAIITIIGFVWPELRKT